MTVNGGAVVVVSVGSLATVWFLFVVGANDAANAIGTTIGSNALHPTGAVVLAMSSQFVGACFAGHRADLLMSSNAFEPLPGDAEADIRCTFICNYGIRVVGASKSPSKPAVLVGGFLTESLCFVDYCLCSSIVLQWLLLS
jgi:hypothetical protein